MVLWHANAPATERLCREARPFGNAKINETCHRFLGVEPSQRKSKSPPRPSHCASELEEQLFLLFLKEMVKIKLLYLLFLF